MTADTTYTPRIRSVGLDGVLVTFGDTATDTANRAAIAFRDAVDAWNWDMVAESSSTLVSAFFRIDLAEHRFADISDRLRDVLATQDWSAAALPAGRTLWTIPATFGGDRAPQLAEAAEAAGLSEADALRDLTSTRLRVLTLGFAPGQPYLGTLGKAWNIPRQKELTPNVPTGALVAAVRQICLFAKDTPTGWRHVGQSAFKCFRPHGDTPFPLAPGDEVQFTDISARELAQIEAKVSDGSGGAVREVLE
ncbi:carboxyltransferase domain-containing protein [Tateyamaria sp. ANG-S1]|uniref:5-oxoprolinase subunit B family protein n=1 Tax=Tateyamaria sp. ANG-S1 TaxID=1577905 RepID=UPI00057C65ED|nr:carboxyltransferase domain-containing protein [Tateyamaria sp. ANG-S1]KIC49564.1 allophanate hydrolase [Tateyamaria sp. ANG-S1]